MFDNIIFDVNGRTPKALELALELAFEQSGHKPVAWKVHATKGMIFYWTIPSRKAVNVNKFMSPPSAKPLTDLIYDWLETDEAKTIETIGYDEDHDHDGHNSLGWRVYTESWGHINEEWEAFLAVKPAYLWHGK